MRMYSLVSPYLSDIQKGIQSGHAWVKFVDLFGNRDEVSDWIDHHKTVVILSYGFDIVQYKLLKSYLNSENNHSIRFYTFREPELNGLETTCFLLNQDQIELMESVKAHSKHTSLYDKYLEEDFITEEDHFLLKISRLKLA